ncbi:MAG: sugar phosphate isomerase/epimerase [Planctomycetota bacterium]|nr:sugar phosphate isomerase/epimerase [Planctomycetota bacterium]
MYVSTRDAMLKHTGIADPWAALKALEVNAVELNFTREATTDGFHGNGGKPFELGAEAGRKAAKAAFDAHGAKVCALLMANDFAGDLDAEVAWGVSAVRAAAALGAPAVRVDMVPRRKDIALDAFTQRCVEAARRILAETEGSGVALGVENHGHISNDPAFLDKIFAGVGSERMGLTLDTGNFYWWGHPIDKIYGIMERFAARARHTHAKNINYPPADRARQREIGWEYKQYCCPLDEGNMDHARIAKILKAAGYAGSLCLEDESLGKFPESERLGILQRNIRHLKSCLV